jgi:hypothetical protein
VPVSAGRRFSQAISEGDGISLIALVERAGDESLVEPQTADAVLVSPAHSGLIAAVRARTELPIVAQWPGHPSADLDGVDACLLPVDSEREWLERVHADLSERIELAFQIEDDEHMATALEDFDPEIFVLGASDKPAEEALEGVLDLLPDVPAGKLAIADLSDVSPDELGALERAGFDGVIVDPRRLAGLAPVEPPEV